ncbi:MAG TPA: glutathione S-transferase family protein [Kofleriaceae bacterium]
MLLYHDLRAPNPRRVRIFLAEKGVAYDTIEVEIAKAANLSPEFRKKNPLALLPVLELANGKVLRESIAISRYIEELHPEPNLFGADPWERAVVEQWNRHAELELLIPMAQVFRNTHAFFSGRIRQSAEYGEIVRELVIGRFDFFNNELASRPYLAGERYTVADITALCAIDFGKVSKIRVDPATHPHLAAWHARVSERPSAKA